MAVSFPNAKCNVVGGAGGAGGRPRLPDEVTFDRITTDPERMGGVPCIRDLRFPAGPEPGRDGGCVVEVGTRVEDGEHFGVGAADGVPTGRAHPGQ
jgi:hypothetical protein